MKKSFFFKTSRFFPGNGVDLQEKMLYNAPRKNLKNVKEYVPMKKRSFTLVEILVAIPVISRSMETAKLNQAAAECNTIQLAIKNFETEYSMMPYPKSAETGAPPNTGSEVTSEKQYCVGGYTTSPDTKYKFFFSMMIGYQYDNPSVKTGLDSETDTAVDPADWANNKKRMKFLDPTSNYAKGKGFLDPWGKTYSIVYKTDGEMLNKLEGLDASFVPAGLSPKERKEKLLTPIAVFTREGTPKSNPEKDDTVRYATSWEGAKTYSK